MLKTIHGKYDSWSTMFLKICCVPVSRFSHIDNGFGCTILVHVSSGPARHLEQTQSGRGKLEGKDYSIRYFM